MCGFRNWACLPDAALRAGEPRTKSGRISKNFKFHIFTMAQLAKRRPVREVEFLPRLDPRKQAEIARRQDLSRVRDRMSQT
jgi:hypothetical protein